MCFSSFALVVTVVVVVVVVVVVRIAFTLPPLDTYVPINIKATDFVTKETSDCVVHVTFVH